MKKTILILLLSLATLCSYGQSARFIHGCVYGKGKEPIEGAIISTVQGDFICKTDENGQFRATTKSYVAQIKVSSEHLGSQTVDVDGSYLVVNLCGHTPQAKRTLAPVKKGYEQEISITNQGFFSGDGSIMLNINYIGGYRFGPHLFIGLGTGLDFNLLSDDYYRYCLSCYTHDEKYCEYCRYEDYGLNIVTIPLYAHLRTYLSKKRCAPFFGFSGGVRILTNTEIYGIKRARIRPMGEFSIGLNIRCSNNFALNMQVGFPFGNVLDKVDFANKSAKSSFDFGYTARIGFVF